MFIKLINHFLAKKSHQAHFRKITRAQALNQFLELWDWVREVHMYSREHDEEGEELCGFQEQKQQESSWIKKH